MRGFLAGFLFGAACTAGAAAGAYLVYVRPASVPAQAMTDPCAACGPGTRCEARHCVPAPPQANPGKRRRRTSEPSQPSLAGIDPGNGTEPQEAPEPPPPMLSAAELRPQRVGDDLSRAPAQTMDLTRAEAGDGRELTQEDLDAVFERARPAVIACIERARGAARPSGRVTVGLRVQRSGAVAGVQVEAPAFLIKNDLLSCVRGACVPLRFPPSGSSQTVTYPFALR